MNTDNAPAESSAAKSAPTDAPMATPTPPNYLCGEEQPQCAPLNSHEVNAITARFAELSCAQC